jgi:hypothetical protein
MRLKFAPVVLVALSVVFGALCSLSSPAWAKGKDKAEKSGDVPDSINRQFQWEEGVVGPNEKKLDHKKIAAMQAAARKEDAAHKNEPTVKKTERPAGVGAPSSATPPTMDIEKPAPVAARPSRPRAPVQAAPKTHDSLDQLLDSERDTGAGRSHGDGGLGKMLAVGDQAPAHTAAATPPLSSSSRARSAPRQAKARHAHRGR